MITVTDLFAGAGGSSSGAIQVPGEYVTVPCVSCAKPRQLKFRNDSQLRKSELQTCRECWYAAARKPEGTRRCLCTVCGATCAQYAQICRSCYFVARAAAARKCCDCGGCVGSSSTARCLPCWIAYRGPAKRPAVPAPLYVDEMAVERLRRGDRVKANAAERRAAIAALAPYKLTTRQIAERLHVTTRTVERLRAQLVAA